METMQTEGVYVLVVRYLAPLDQIDEAMDSHRCFLDRFYASGEFLASGPQRPRGGGVILARCASRARAEQIVAEDPFVQRGLAAYEVIEFRPNRGPFAQPLLEAGATTT
jgi:uncharacterized protein YciI